jgi:prepilin-type N-terminal cleavage/methylation domain-containing protein
MSRRAAGRQRGFSLLELLIVMALFTFALAVGIGLLGEAQRLFSGASAGAGERDEASALRRLKSDLKALEPAGGSFVWSERPLVLLGEDGAVAWAVEGERLVRARAPRDGEPTAAALLDGVVAFRWHLAHEAFVEVEIVRLRTARPAALRLLGPRWKERPQQLERHRIAVARRSGA